MSSNKKVLVLGGTGYLGQHLLQHLSKQPFDLAFTYHSTLPPQPLLQAIHSDCIAFPLDSQNEAVFFGISKTFGQVSIFH